MRMQAEGFGSMWKQKCLSMVGFGQLRAVAGGSRNHTTENRSVGGSIPPLGISPFFPDGGPLFKAAILSTLLSVGSEAGMSGNNNGSLAEAIQQGMSQSVGRETGRGAVEPAKLIGPMLARFMATDRAFSKLRHADGTPQSSL